MKFLLTGALFALAAPLGVEAVPANIGCDGKSTKNGNVDLLPATGAIGSMGDMSVDDAPPTVAATGTGGMKVTVTLTAAGQHGFGVFGTPADKGTVSGTDFTANAGCTYVGVVAGTKTVEWTPPVAGGTFQVHGWSSTGFGAGIKHWIQEVVVTAGTEVPDCTGFASGADIASCDACDAAFVSGTSGTCTDGTCAEGYETFTAGAPGALPTCTQKTADVTSSTGTADVTSSTGGTEVTGSTTAAPEKEPEPEPKDDASVGLVNGPVALLAFVGTGLALLL